MNLLCQTMRRSVESGGLYRDIERGIARGSALSSLLGAVYLHALDTAMEKLGVFYMRYCDAIGGLQMPRAACVAALYRPRVDRG